MSESRWTIVKRHLNAALAAAPEDRHALLDALEPDLRREVFSLMAADERESSLDSESPGASLPTLSLHPEATDASEGRIGPYRLRRKIGEGGMGVVYEAEQERPVRRQVALKLIKRGMDTKAIIARFESERQALALMSHANIARVYDAGASEQGRPYFAMEYVHGIPITEYCDQRRLTVEERLRLFMKVCEGVQHAHQKGIIHRDIKPSNVLVTDRDDHVVPKIIDFGVAKATSQRLTELTMATELGQVIGTPGYMSPEQAEVTNLDIDTRTDVYSLGVLLYELLVGAQPFDVTALRGAALAEFQRKLREEEPLKPSTRLSGLGDASRTTASNRRVELAVLQRQLQGDLDWITMKAIEKDRTRRYESASSLGADVGRFLKSEPVLARAPSASYRTRKFVRRHRVGVAALGTVLLSLIVAVAMTGSSLMRARRAEDEAKLEAARAGAISEFLQEMLTSADPAQDGRDVKVVDVLARASETADTTFDDQPETEAAVRSTLAATLIALGQYREAVDEFEKTVHIHQSSLGEADETTLRAMNDLVGAYFYAGRLDQAEQLSREAVRVATERFGTDHDVSIETSVNLAAILNARGLVAEAAEVERRTLEAATARYGEEHETTMIVANNLAHSLKQLERPEEALPIYRELVDTRTRASGGSHPQTLNVKHNLAMLLNELGESAEAVSLHRELVAEKIDVLGPDHPQTLTSRNGLALALLADSRLEESREVFEELIPSAVAAHAPGSSVPFKYIRHYGVCLKRLGRFAESELELLRAVDGLEAALGDDNFETLRAVEELHDLYQIWGKPEQAARYRTRIAPSK